MANLTADAPLIVINPHSHRFNCDSSGAYTIYKGCGLVIDANVDTVNVHTAASLTLVDGDVFVGIAAEKHAVASGASETDEASLVEAYVGPSIVGFKSSVHTNADVGKQIGMSDTGTLITYGDGISRPPSSGGAYPRIGILQWVEDGYEYVLLETPFIINVT